MADAWVLKATSAAIPWMFTGWSEEGRGSRDAMKVLKKERQAADEARGRYDVLYVVERAVFLAV